MSEHPDLSHVSLTVDGDPAPAEAATDLVEVVVDHSLHLPSMFSLRLFSHDMKWLEDPTFREGRKIEIFLGERPPVKLLSGRIAGLEPELGEGDPSLVIRGYDLSHKLYRGRHRRSFTQVTDSDLARRLAAEVSLRPGTIDSTAEVHEYVFQNNQSNAEFLLERARRLGFELWVEDDSLHFRRPRPNGAAVRLAWGDNLRGFRPRLSTAEQVDEVEVRGWDPSAKREVVGRARRGNGAPEIGLGRPGSDIARDAWGEARVAVVDQFVRSPAEADALAQATLDELASVFVEAEGTCDANPLVVPGRQVDIQGVGRRFSGICYVTRVVHEWSRDHGMTTHFTVSGRRDRGVWSLLEDAAPRRVGVGVVIGIVTNNRDPEDMGRVRVKFPWLSDQDESAWARLASPMAGADRGFFYLPEIDDEVLVAFEHGDIHRPTVLGVLWNGRDKPPLPASEAVGGDGKVNKRIVKSRSGHTITLDDTAGGEEITIVDKTGQNKIVLHSPDNSMRITVQGDLTIEAQGKITLKGAAGVDVSSQAEVKLSGQAGTELSSPAQTTVKGGIVSVEGSGPVRVRGTPIQLN
jgi:phage protein D/phage baseplate assembly protein gpV